MSASRRSFLTTLGASALGATLSSGNLAHAWSARAHRAGHTDGRPQDRPRPTPAQLTWQRDELALFLHFGVNTFTDREWGDGTESPSIFATPMRSTVGSGRAPHGPPAPRR
jgi:alpha-L-fucosidase